MVEALFSAHFTDGLDIGNHAVLVAIAGACGLDGAAARRFLVGNDEGMRSTPTICGRIGWASTASRASSSPAAMPSRARRSPR